MTHKRTHIWKRVVSVLLCCLLCFTVCAACDAGEQDNGDGGNSDLPDAPAGSVITVGSTPALLSGDYRLDFVSQGNGSVVQLVDTTVLSAKDAASTEASVMFVSETPAQVTVMTNKSVLNYRTADFAASYSSVQEQSYGWLCTATVTTENGSEIRFEDSYYVLADGAFALSRRTQVVTAGSGDQGFETLFSMADPGGATSANGFDFFIPSILYKDTQEMTGGALASNLNVSKVYIKETRTGLPLAMLRDSERTYSVALAHFEPKIDVGTTLGGGSNGDADNGLQYGSIGYSVTSGVSVDFCYPSAEGPSTYDAGAGWKRVFHEMTAGTVQEYKVSVIPEKQSTYAKSMTETFKTAFEAESPAIAEDVDIDQVYDDNIEVFNKTYAEFGTGSVTAAGVPWSIDLDTPEEYGDWSTSEGYSFQMGFVGQQTSVGYNLLAAGTAAENDEMIAQGKAILNFWTSDTIMSGELPHVWWDPREDATAGSTRGYPSFLRCFVDGMEGILDAYIFAVENGDTDPSVTQWYNAVNKIGVWMIENQNDDGSFYRAYETNGEVCTRQDDTRYQGTSKLNTPVAIRFLVRMYENTGDTRYREAAVKAAEFSYNELYIGLEKYVGGTPDNPNTVDKEAAIYAMYGFDAAYELTGEEKYLEAAQHAAVSALSWVYCYDFAVPSGSSDANINCFAEGGVSGFSLIATGHSGADNYSAALYYEFFKMYLYTEEEFYLHAAQFLQQNTKLSTDYKGELGYAFRAIGPEATNVSDFSFGTVGVWLPWSGIVNIQPIGYMRATFGNADIADLLGTELSALQEQLAAYGSGGKID